MAQVPQVPDGVRLLRWPEVLRRVGFSRTTANNLVKEGGFPTPHRIRPKVTVFREDEVDQWIHAALDRASRKGAAS